MKNSQSIGLAKIQVGRGRLGAGCQSPCEIGMCYFAVLANHPLDLFWTFKVSYRS